MQISESEMLFGDYDEDNCFWIENTDMYKSIAGKGYKSVEFVLHRPDRNELLFPTLDDQTFEWLKNSILVHGCREPLVFRGCV